MGKASSFFATLQLNSKDKDNALPRIAADTLFTTSGYKKAENQNIKITTSLTLDSNFKFIPTNSASLFAYRSNSGYNGLANQANSFPRSQSGLNYKIKSVEKRGDKKHGYVYYAKIGSGLINYEIDVENAIASGEIAVPDEYKPKPKQTNTVVEIKQPVSVADELIKLKKLYVDSIFSYKV